MISAHWKILKEDEAIKPPPPSDDSRAPKGSRCEIRRLRRMGPARFDVPTPAFDVLPDALPDGFGLAVSGLELPRLDHSKAPARPGTEGVDEVARLGHGHDQASQLSRTSGSVPGGLQFGDCVYFAGLCVGELVSLIGEPLNNSSPAGNPHTIWL
jgi:hypothetical protein